MSLSIQDVEQYLEKLIDPETGRLLGVKKQVGEIQLNAGKLNATIRLSPHSSILFDEITSQWQTDLLQEFPELETVQFAIERWDREPPAIGQVNIHVRNLIAIGSGKGGVGKSTLAAALAITLSRAGARVGLLDGDVYGPSIPHLLGLNGHPQIFDGKIQPVQFENIPVMSMAFLVKKEEAIVWRGPMLHGAINQLLSETNWGSLDYLIVDMPPGTGDVALTLSQLVPVSGAVVVCTPQKVALIDAVRAVSMLRSLQIPVVGMIENMSGFVCPHCQTRSDIFGKGGAQQSAESWNVPFLGAVPLNMEMQRQSDEGSLVSALDDPICGDAIQQIARNLVRQINQNTKANPPKIALPVLA